MSTSKTLIFLSALLLALSLIFGVFNFTKALGLKTLADQGETARREAQQLRLARDKDLKTNAKSGAAPGKAATGDVDLAKSKTEKDELLAKLKASETEIAQLQQRLAETAAKPAASPGASAGSTTELQTELEETRKQLDAAEREKAFLSDKLKGAPECPAIAEAGKNRLSPGGGNPGLRGTVLAVNQAYNFVVLTWADGRAWKQTRKCSCYAAARSLEKSASPQLNRLPLSAISLPAAWPVKFRCNLETSSFMLALVPESLIKAAHSALLAAALLPLASCATKEPPPLIADPAAHGETALPWNEQQKWEKEGPAGAFSQGRRN